MIISRTELFVIPQCLFGVKVAAEMEQKFKEQGVFKGRTDSTTAIQIWVEYHFTIKENEK